MQNGVTLEILHVLVAGDWSVLELKASGVAKKGWEVDNRYCWVIQWRAGLIQTIRAYPDSAMVQRLIGESTEEG